MCKDGEKMENKYYSLADIIKSLPKKKNSRSSLWVKIIVRKISFIFTYVFVNLRVSPWLASVFSAIIAFVGSAFLCIDNQIFRIIGVILIQLWLVFDCVDGNIARVTKKCSEMGDFIDTLSGYVISAFSLLGIGIAAYNTTSFGFFKENFYLIVFGALGCIGNVLARVVHQNYMVTILKLNNNNIHVYNPDEDVEKDKGLGFIRSRIDKEIGISGIFMPLLILAAIFGYYDLFVIAYGTFFFLSSLFILFYYAMKSRK